MLIYETLVKEFLGEAETKEKSLEVIFDPDMAPLKIPMNNRDVRAWQWALITLGYDIGTFGPKGNGVDGKFGPETDAGTRKFQKDNKTTVDGIAGPRTLSIMNAKLAEKGIEEIPGYKKTKLPVKQGPEGKDTVKKKKSSPSSVKGLPRPENARQVFDHMKSLGFNDIQAAAWVGCIAGESGFNPSIVGDEIDKKTGKKYHSYGIVQWNLGRFKRLQQFAKNLVGTVDGWKNNLKLQLEYLGWELDHKYQHVVARLKKTQDSLEKSLYTLIEHYEIPGDIPGEYAKRLPMARAALAAFAKQTSDSEQPQDTEVSSTDEIPSLSEEIQRIKYLIKF